MKIQIAILAALISAGSSAFAQGYVDVYVHEGGGGPPSLNDYITSFRYHVKEGLRLTEGHDNPLAILQMNPEIKERADTLMRYGFTRAQVEREFQIVIAEYEAEKARKEENDRNMEQLWDNMNRGTGNIYNPYRKDIHALERGLSPREKLKLRADRYVRSREGNE